MMRHQNTGMAILVSLAALFFSAASVYAETAQEYYNLGLRYGVKGNDAQAIFYFTKAIEIDPKNAYAYSSRGQCFYNQGNFAQALSDFSKAIELDPNADVYAQRAQVYCDVRQYDNAWADVAKSEELGYTIPDRDFLAKLKKASGRDK